MYSPYKYYTQGRHNFMFFYHDNKYFESLNLESLSESW